MKKHTDRATFERIASGEPPTEEVTDSEEHGQPIDDELAGDDYVAGEDHYADSEDGHEDHGYGNSGAYEAPHYSSAPRRLPLRALGIVVTLAGIGAMAAWSSIPELQDALQSTGVAPIHIVILGVILAGIGGLGARVDARMSDGAGGHGIDDLAAQVALLVQAEENRGSGTSGAMTGDAAQQLSQAVHLLTRQEEKIVNLSKATKMYGKPLVEISSQVAESNRAVADAVATINALKIIVERFTDKAGASTGGGASVGQLTAEMREVLDGAMSRVTSKQDELRESVDSAKRSTDSALNNLQEEVTKGFRASSTLVRDEIGQMDEKLEAARKTISKAVEGMPADGSGGADLEKALATIRDELAQLGSRVERAAAAAPAAAAPAPAAAPADAPAQAGATPAAKTDGKPVSGKDDGVLSAIAKLKQMRN